MVVLIGHAKIKPSEVESFMTLANGMLLPSREEEGCISYDFYCDRADSNKVVFVEEWVDGSALEFHFATPHFKDFMERSATMLAEEPRIKIYSVENVHQL
ncbi:putative quinol monooxygenase [Kamptonema cortianum]|nr:putative quinol monooxygenase [Geitlerinema splendidum]MDK3158488.1 putative quinol monooxygenase [Kamptonema cortianum]